MMQCNIRSRKKVHSEERRGLPPAGRRGDGGSGAAVSRQHHELLCRRACLAFDRRGHDILSIRDSRAAEGAAFHRRSAGSCDVEIVPSCDHFYVRREAAICDLVSGWLARTLKILHFVIPASAQGCPGNESTNCGCTPSAT
jgi:hypothetical protein